GADQTAPQVGPGSVRGGIVSPTLGTSGVCCAASDAYRLEPEGRLHAFCHAVPDRWHLMGVMLSAGGSFRWFRDALALADVLDARARSGGVYDGLTAEAPAAPAAAAGLLLLPLPS